MEDILLYKMLAQLSAEEYKRLLVFAESPFFNTEKKAIKMLEILRIHHPDFQKSSALSSESLIKKLSLGTDGTLRNLRWRVLRLLWDFLSYQSLKSHPNAEALLLLDTLLKRKMKDAFREKLLELSDKLDADDNLHRSRFLLNDFRLQGLLQGWESPVVFQNYMDSCDAYFLLNKIKIACQLLMLQRIRQQYDEHPAFKEMEFLLPFHAELIAADPALHAWKIQYDLLKNLSGGGEFDDFLAFIQQNAAKIPATERRQLYTTAQNLLVGRLNSGHFNTLPELKGLYANLHVLYQFAAAQDLLLEDDGFIPQQRFKNVVSTACNAGETTQASQFLAEKLSLVLPKDQEDLRFFCLGAIAFYADDFKTAARNLACVSPHGNDFYYFDIATLQSRIFYEEDDPELFEKKADAVRQKLKSSELSQNYRDSYANFFRMLRELFKLKYDPNRPKSDWEQLRQTIEITNPLNQKKWLLEACERTSGFYQRSGTAARR